MNTSKLLLGSEASSLFGRYIISLVLRAAFERTAIPEAKRKPTFLFIDEASDYVDQSFEALLSKIRQFNIGVLMAFQHITQIGGVLNSVLANTTVKLCGGLNMHDARVLAGEMRCDPTFISDLKKAKYGTEWACHVRNLTSHAVKLETQFGLLDREPQMTAEEHAAVIARNKARYSAPPELPPPPEPRDTGPPAPAQAAGSPIPPLELKPETKLLERPKVEW